jgi:queuosine precursor transporter
MESKIRRLFVVIGAFFITNAILAEFIGVKIFSLEKSLGFQPLNWSILGIEGLSLNLTAGALLWPFVFVLTDIINEYFGRRGVRLLSYLAIICIAYAFAMVMLAIQVVPADFWIMKDVTKHGHVVGQVNMDSAFNAVYGQGLWIIIGSLTAFLISQLVDVYVFSQMRRISGHKRLWVRSTVSTLVSQIIDSFVVLYIAFYIGAGYDLKWVIAVMIVNYLYKFTAAIVFIPVIYLVHKAIVAYLGPRVAARLADSAHKTANKS